MNPDWPFDDPKDVAVVTVRDVMHEVAPILLVHRTEEGWQFLTGKPFDMKDALLVSLESVVRRDPTLLDLADLPLGWSATRERVGAPWLQQMS